MRVGEGTQKNLTCHTPLALGAGVAPSPSMWHPGAGASQPRWLSDGGAVSLQRPRLRAWQRHLIWLPGLRGPLLASHTVTAPAA
jgi:hypothetical protein